MRRLPIFSIALLSCIGVHGKPRVVDVDFVQANRLLGEGRARESLYYYEQALQRDPKNPFYLYYYGLALAGTGDTVNAAEAFGSILESNPGDPLAADALGNILIARREFPEAIGVYDALHQANPTYSSLAKVRKARIYLLMSEMDSSFAEASGALTESPFSPEAWYLMATYYAQKNDGDNALRCLEKAVDLDESLKEKSRQDPMFAPLYDNPVFRWMTRTAE